MTITYEDLMKTMKSYPLTKLGDQFYTHVDFSVNYEEPYSKYEQQFIDFLNAIEDDFFIRVENIELSRFENITDGNTAEYSMLDLMVYLEYQALQESKKSKSMISSQKLYTNIATRVSKELQLRCRSSIKTSVKDCIKELKCDMFFNFPTHLNWLLNNNAISSPILSGVSSGVGTSTSNFYQMYTSYVQETPEIDKSFINEVKNFIDSINNNFYTQLENVEKHEHKFQLINAFNFRYTLLDTILILESCALSGKPHSESTSVIETIMSKLNQIGNEDSRMAIDFIRELKCYELYSTTYCV